jgi:GNAT superfamily N-acetyltransferase
MSVARRTEAWEQILNTGHTTTLVADINGTTIGFADYGPARDEDLDARSNAELNALYVLPAYWSRSCGFELWSKVQSLLGRLSFGTLVIWVLEGNRRGRHFYERQGCLIDAGARKLWRPETEALVEVRYSRPLP